MPVKSDPIKNAVRFHHRRAIALGVESTLTIEEWADVLKVSGFQCVYCGIVGPIEMDHVIPLTRGGGNVKANVAPACARCNSVKSNRTPEEWSTGTICPRPDYAKWVKRVRRKSPVINNDKRCKGRPIGSCKPDDEYLHPHTVRLTDAEWAACRDTGDASAFVRQAIKESRGM